MSEFQYKAGLGNVGNYQVSGIPYVTGVLAPIVSGAPLELSFPSVTKFIVVKNVNSGSHALRVGFSANGIKGTNYFTLEKDESFSADFRVTKLYLLGNTANTVDTQVLAGLTGIDAAQLTGSWSGSLGVG